MKKTQSKEAPRENKSKEQLVEEMKQADIRARQQRLNQKFDLALKEEQFNIQLVLKTDPNTLVVAPSIQLIDTKYVPVVEPKAQ